MGAALVVASSACTTVVETTRIEVEQAALIPAPSGPHAMGPQLAAKQVSFEGGVSGHQVIGDTAGNSLGNVLGALAIRGRLAVGLVDEVELGADFEYVGQDFGTALSRNNRASPKRDLFMGGAQLRFLLGEDWVRFGLSGEVSFASLPFSRQVESTVTTEIFDTSGALISTRTESFFTENDEPVFYVFSRLAPSVVFLAPQVQGRIGIMIHNQPVVESRASAEVTCTRNTGQFLDNCRGEDLDDVAKVKTTGMLTAFASLGVEATDHLFIVGQMFVHIAGPRRLLDASRLGGAGAVRVVF